MMFNGYTAVGVNLKIEVANLCDGKFRQSKWADAIHALLLLVC